MHGPRLYPSKDSEFCRDQPFKVSFNLESLPDAPYLPRDLHLEYPWGLKHGPRPYMHVVCVFIYIYIYLFHTYIISSYILYIHENAIWWARWKLGIRIAMILYLGREKVIIFWSPSPQCCKLGLQTICTTLPDLVIKNLNHHQTSNVQELYLLIISPGKYSLSRPSAAIPFLHHAATTWRHWKTADYWWIDANGRCNAIHDFIDKSPPNSPSNTLLYFQKTTNNGGAHAAQVKCPTTISSTLPDSASPESSWEFRLQPAGNFCSRWAFWPCRHSEKKSHP